MSPLNIRKLRTDQTIQELKAKEERNPHHTGDLPGLEMDHGVRECDTEETKEQSNDRQVFFSVTLLPTQRNR
jgi:hypothetical protein